MDSMRQSRLPDEWDPLLSTALIPTEDEEQALLFQWARAESQTYPCLSCMFAVPNGGYRNKATAVRMKKTGVCAGVPDIFLPYSNGKEHGLFVEMKRKKHGRVSDAQAEMMGKLSQQGYRCVVCRGFDEARREILDYIRE